MLGTVRTVAFDARGNLYLFDGAGGVRGPWLDPRILVFDATGEFVREFGRAGEGPGEFDAPVTMAVGRDGSVVVSDIGHRGFQIFDEAGTFVRMVRPGLTAVPLLFAMDMYARSDGVYSSPPRSIGAQVAAHTGAVQTSRPIVRLGLDGAAVRTDTVAAGWLPPLPQTADSDVEGIVVQGRRVSFRELGIGQSTVFEPPLLMGVLPDGRVVFSDSTAYALKIARAGAPMERVITRPLDPEPVTPAIQEAEIERQNAMGRPTTRMLQFPGPGGEVETTTIDVPDPAFYPELPLIHKLSSTWEGRIWVQRRGSYPDTDGPIDILTPEGEYIGTIPAGTTAVPDAFGPGGLAAFLELDEMDVATVVVRRLPTAVR